MAVEQVRPENDVERGYAEGLWRLADQMRGQNLPIPEFALALAHKVAERTGRPLPYELRETTALFETLRPRITDLVTRITNDFDSVPGRRILTSILESPLDHGSRYRDLVAKDSLATIVSEALRLDRFTKSDEVDLLDPTFGAGDLALQVGEEVSKNAGTVKICGQEINAETSHLARLNAYFAGTDVDIRTGDSLQQSLFGDKKFDLIVSQPPFGLRWPSGMAQAYRSGYTDFGSFPLGLPTNLSDSSWLFVSKIVSLLKPVDDGGGRAVIFTYAPALLRKDGSDVRRELIERDLLEAVISLPAGAFAPSTDIPGFALVINNNKMQRRKGFVQLIDIRNEFSRERHRGFLERTLTQEGTAKLHAALRSVKNGPISRTVPNEHFLRMKIAVGRRGLVWPVEIPADQDIDAFIRERYDEHTVARVGESVELSTTIDTLSAFERNAKVASNPGAVVWPEKRLSQFVTGVVVDLDERRLSIPTRPDVRVIPASGSPSEDPTTDEARQIRFEIDETKLLSDYVNGWLRSANGNASVRRALSRLNQHAIARVITGTPTNYLRLADEILIPVPPLEMQRSVAKVDAMLESAQNLLDSSRETVWANLSGTEEISALFEPLLDEGTGRWAQELPYPLAAALWTMETKNTDIERHAQIFLVWEAYVAYLAIVLMSVLKADSEQNPERSDLLDELVHSDGVTPTHASFGGWLKIAERLAAAYRKDLTSDTSDDRQEVSFAFAGADTRALERILGVDSLATLEQARTLRNQWKGHSGSLTQREVRTQIDHLEGLLSQLQKIVGLAWRKVQLVRAKSARLRDGMYIQQVEVLHGPQTPFRLEEVEVAEMMDEGLLYLVGGIGSIPVPILPLIALEAAPETDKYATYFFNRFDSEGMRMVSYQAAHASDLHMPLGEHRSFSSMLKKRPSSTSSWTQIDGGPVR